MRSRPEKRCTGCPAAHPGSRPLRSWARHRDGRGTWWPSHPLPGSGFGPDPTNHAGRPELLPGRPGDVGHGVKILDPPGIEPGSDLTGAESGLSRHGREPRDAGHVHAVEVGRIGILQHGSMTGQSTTPQQLVSLDVGLALGRNYAMRISIPPWRTGGPPASRRALRVGRSS